MSPYLSNKLTILYTLLIIMVAYIHSYYLEAEQYPTALFLQKLIGGGVCRVANCMFFCISGYLLFARGVGSLKEIGGKQRKRVRTLLVPYLLWNVIFVMWYVVLENLPGLERFNNSAGMLDRIFNASLGETLYHLFIVPAAFQLWFLRDLIGMLILSPLLWWITKRQWRVSLALAILSTILYPSWIIYFWIGLIIALRKWDIENYPHPVWAVGMGGALFLGYAVYVALGNDTIRFMEIVVNFIGLYLLWYLYDLFAVGKCLADRGVWKYICGYSFFIYCFHEPAFNIIKKLALVVCGRSEFVLIFFYFLNPLIMELVAVMIAKLMQRWIPGMYAILTGGR